MAILFTVCGRAGSKGFQSKNLKDFLGVPLVYYTLAAIRLWQQRADEEIDVVLNTDSEAASSPPRKACRYSSFTAARSLAAIPYPKSP